MSGMGSSGACEFVGGPPHGTICRIDRCGERWFAHPPPEPFAEFPPLKSQRRAQARLEKPLALRRFEPRPALHGALKQRISVRHLAAFQNENSANEPQKSKFANMLLATEISAHDVAARTVLREGAAVTRWRSGAPLFQRPALPSSALLSRIDCGWIAARLRDRHNGDFDRKVAEAALGAAVCPADPNALKC
jgi:hypothetical protein